MADRSDPSVIRGWSRWLVMLSVLLIVTAACTSDDESTSSEPSPDDTSLANADPGDCIVVDMAVSPEKFQLLTELAREFNGSAEAEVGGECVFVRPQKKSSGAGMQLLADGWSEDVVETEGPQPVVWSPAASTWGAILNQRLEAEGEAPMATAGTPFMVTPLIIAMPEPMAEALGWPDEPIGWSDILELSRSDEGWAAFGHPEWGPFRLGKTNPNFSTSGLAALIAQTYAATGKQTDLSLEDLNNPQVQDYAEDIESSVVHYGDTTLTFLNNWYAADQRDTALTYASAAAVEEKSIIDYNSGNPDGTLDLGEEPRPPRIPLVAIYPTEGTLYSDNPLFILDAPWVSDEQKQGAELFTEFVQRPENQEKVLEFGFRPGNSDVAIGAPIDSSNNVDPDQPQTLLEVPEPQVMAELLEFWNDTRKGARVLLVIDVSGSMGDAGDPETGETKLDLAKRAAVEALDQFKDDDEVGLRIFTTDLGTPDGGYWADVVPIGGLGDQKDEITSAIQGLYPLQGTPLYAVTRDSYDTMVEGYDPARINAVVLLSDGRNDLGTGTDTSGEFNDLVDYLQEQSESELSRPVRIFPIAYGGDADFDTLQAIAEATNAAAYDSSDPRSIDKVFSQVVSNF